MGRTGTRRRANAAPKEWGVLPADHPYPCEAKHVGAVVGGPGGGQITACATPSAARPGEGQYWVGAPVPGGGHPIEKRTVTRRLYDQQKRGHRKADPLPEVAAAVEYQRGADAVPGPTGVELPHDPARERCSLGHPLWGPEYREAVARATEGAFERRGIGEDLYVPEAIEELEVPFANPPQTSADADIRAEVLAHPRGPEWASTADACVAKYDKRAAARAAKADKAQRRWEESQRKKAAKKAAAAERAWQRKAEAAVRKAQKKATKKKPNKGKRKRRSNAPGACARVILTGPETKRWKAKHAATVERVVGHVAAVSLQCGGPVDLVAHDGKKLGRIQASPRALA